ncbi:hypothetical protein MYOV003v1_p0215 [Vibrio phage 207E48.1]|nr:hypothetical protein MYOV003v1_p0215 [Vibrio phage 207E48.1]
MFEYFPQRWFKDADGDQILMTNLCRRVTIPKEFRDNAALYMSYSIRNGETARDIADRLYGDHTLYWVVYLANNIMDVMNEWPINSHQLQEHMVARYGWEGLDNVHHYEDANGFVTDMHALRLKSGDLTKTNDELIALYSVKTITVEQYELDTNDAKRRIKLIDPDHVSRFKSSIEELLNV